MFNDLDAEEGEESKTNDDKDNKKSGKDKNKKRAPESYKSKGSVD
jgi:hypothetical protein